MHRRIVVLLRLDNERHRYMLGVIERLHAGRSPLFRAIAMAQDGDTLVEAAEVHPDRGKPLYTVVRWELRGLAVSWCDQPSREAALTIVDEVRGRLRAAG